MNNIENIKFIYGLEIHVQLNTLHKLFSSALNDVYALENQNVSIIDLGMAGTYPITNANAIIKAIKGALLFNCKISKILSFDRKHYRYIDLPASYQITQYENPIGINGYYKINDTFSVNIKDVHIECDAAKTKEYDNKIIIDYNRCCVPLIEIVTQPDFRDVSSIELFLNLLIQDLRINDISEARFEMSQIRADVNISMQKNNQSSPRLEIKNLNSIRSIKRSIALTQNLLQNNTIVHDYTVHYDDIHNTINLARKKESAAEYMYMHEYGIPTITTKIFMSKINKSDIILTIDSIAELEKKCSKIDKGSINLIISNARLRYAIEKYISLYSLGDYTNAVYYILELRESIDNINNNDSILLILYLVNMMVEKLILKIHVKTLVVLIVDEQINTILELEEYISLNKMLIKQELLCTCSDILNVLNKHDSSLVNRLNEKKIFNYSLGIIIKSIPGIQPSTVRDLLLEITKQQT